MSCVFRIDLIESISLNIVLLGSKRLSDIMVARKRLSSMKLSRRYEQVDMNEYGVIDICIEFQ